ncbi:MAG: sensor histidine kinase, partial [Pyramidobacter sp.]|nr:sensor histidine kinase [Pyramidobacter sp.]
MKRSLTAVLLLSLLIPAASVTMTAGIGIGIHERAMERVVESYALNIAGDMAARISVTDLPPSRLGEIMNRMEHFLPFAWGAKLPGWVIILDSDRKPLFASSDSAPEFSAQAIDSALNRAVCVRSAQGELSTIAVYPAGGRRGYYVMAVVRWESFLGPILNSGMIWLFLVLILFFSCVAALVVLWKWIIGPLQHLVDDIDVLRWGDA